MADPSYGDWSEPGYGTLRVPLRFDVMREMNYVVADYPYHIHSISANANIFAEEAWQIQIVFPLNPSHADNVFDYGNPDDALPRIVITDVDGYHHDLSYRRSSVQSYDHDMSPNDRTLTNMRYHPHVRRGPCKSLYRWSERYFLGRWVPIIDDTGNAVWANLPPYGDPLNEFQIFEYTASEPGAGESGSREDIIVHRFSCPTLPPDTEEERDAQALLAEYHAYWDEYDAHWGSVDDHVDGDIFDEEDADEDLADENIADEDIADEDITDEDVASEDILDDDIDEEEINAQAMLDEYNVGLDIASDRFDEDIDDEDIEGNCAVACPCREMFGDPDNEGVPRVTLETIYLLAERAIPVVLGWSNIRRVETGPLPAAWSTIAPTDIQALFNFEPGETTMLRQILRRIFLVKQQAEEEPDTPTWEIEDFMLTQLRREVHAFIRQAAAQPGNVAPFHQSDAPTATENESNEGAEDNDSDAGFRFRGAAAAAATSTSSAAERDTCARIAALNLTNTDSDPRRPGYRYGILDSISSGASFNSALTYNSYSDAGAGASYYPEDPHNPVPPELGAVPEVYYFLYHIAMLPTVEECLRWPISSGSATVVPDVEFTPLEGFNRYFSLSRPSGGILEVDGIDPLDDSVPAADIMDESVDVGIVVEEVTEGVGALSLKRKFESEEDEEEECGSAKKRVELQFESGDGGEAGSEDEAEAAVGAEA